jgi:hypothetical protein
VYPTLCTAKWDSLLLAKHSNQQHATVPCVHNQAAAMLLLCTLLLTTSLLRSPLQALLLQSALLLLCTDP